MLADYPFNPVHLLWGFPLMVLLWVGLPVYLIYRFWRMFAENSSRHRFLRLPAALNAKIAAWPECLWGEQRVTLLLVDSRKIPDVIVVGGAIRKIGRRSVCRPSDL